MLVIIAVVADLIAWWMGANMTIVYSLTAVFCVCWITRSMLGLVISVIGGLIAWKLGADITAVYILTAVFCVAWIIGTLLSSLLGGVSGVLDKVFLDSLFEDIQEVLEWFLVLDKEPVGVDKNVFEEYQLLAATILGGNKDD